MSNSVQYTEVNLVNFCYEQIHNYIVTGNFKPGKKLKVKDLKDLLHVGHSPIREALSRLAVSGLVQAIDNKGFYVAPISESNIRDIYHTFLQIELLALTQAIKHGDDEWKTSIVATLYHLSLVENDAQTKNLELWKKRNYEFHLALIAGCNSPALLQIRLDIYQKFDRYCQISFTIASNNQLLHNNHEEHKNIADAVLSRDTTTAITIMTNHILGSLEDVIQTLKKHNLFS